MMTKEQLEKFIADLDAQAKEMNDPNAGITYELGRTGSVHLSTQQKKALLKAEEDLGILKEKLQNIDDLTGENFNAKDFVIAANRARGSMVIHSDALVELEQADNPDLSEVHYHIKMVNLYNQQLSALAEIANKKLYPETMAKKAAAKVKGKGVNQTQANDMGQALFGGHHENVHTNFFKIISNGLEKFKSIIQKVVNARSTVTIPTPQSLDDILSLTKKTLDKRYSDAETEVDEIALYAHKKWKKGSREEQVNVLAETIEYLSKDSKKPRGEQVFKTEAERREIIKGAMLAVKHQINGETFFFNSRLENMLNNMLSPGSKEEPLRTPLDGPTPKKSIDAFNKFRKLQAHTHGSVFHKNSKLTEKIEKAVNDKPWLDKQRDVMPEPQAPKPKKKGLFG